MTDNKYWDTPSIEETILVELIENEPLRVEELKVEQLRQDALVLDEIAWYEAQPKSWPLSTLPHAERPEPGSTMDRYDGPFLDEDGIELEF